jgi:enterochelin esterase family protein
VSVEEHVVTSASTEYSRKVWYAESGPNPEVLCIFLDGEYYVNKMDALASLAGLTIRNQAPPMACLFVSHVDGTARHQDYTCNSRYAEFLAKDLISWLRMRSGISSVGGHLLGGTSLSGLQAAYTSLHYPDVFRLVLCHSGSFWWNQEWLTSTLHNLPRNAAKYWISVGDKETDSGISHPPTGMRQEVDQISAARRFADAVRKRGNPVHYYLNRGGHDISPWKEELPQAMQWLMTI